MRIVSNEPFDITEYCGHLIITYLYEDKIEVQKFMDELRKSGYHFKENAISLLTILNSNHVATMEEYLEDCGCYVLCLTSHFEKPSHYALRNHIWHQIGILEARHPGSVVPYKASKSCNIELSKSPLQRPHSIDNVESLIRVFHGRFRSTLTKFEFYDNDSLNRSVRKRLGYVKIEVVLNITKKDFYETLEIYNKYSAPVEFNKDSFLRLLRDNLTCGARLIGFGTKERITNHLSLYKNEMKTVTSIDYPVNFSCNHVFKKADEKSDLLGEYWLDIILPIHTLLGVNFKCFIQGNSKLRVNYLENLFKSNFTDKNDPYKVIKTDKLYFSLAFPNEEDFEISESLGIGKKADYRFPQ